MKWVRGVGRWALAMAFIGLCAFIDDPIVKLDGWQTVQVLVIIYVVIQYAESFRKSR